MTSLESFSQAGKNSWSLIVDTSRLEGSLTALDHNKKRLKKISWGKEKKHSEILLKSFKDLLTFYNKNQLAKIYFIQGPGSFTGLRVGAAFVKATAYALGNLPVTCISSFLEDAQNVISENKNLSEFKILVPSVRKKVFCATFTFSGGKWTESIDMNGSFDLTKEIKNCFSSYLKTTEQYSNVKHINRLDESLETAILNDNKINYYSQNKSYLDLYPLYLRQSEAEEKFRYDKAKL